MLRFLLSLLALVSGVAVPGMAAARGFPACETEIGASAQPARPVAGAATRALRLPPAARPVRPRPVILPHGLAVAVPARVPVLIGIDRAHA